MSLSISNKLLPQSDGYLPYYVLLVGVTAITNAISCYQTENYVRRLYAVPPSSSSSSGPTPASGSVTTTQTTTTMAIIEEGPLESKVEANPERRASVMSLSEAGPQRSASNVQAQNNVNPLFARTFASWNLAVGIVRVIAAYHIHEPAWYQMQIITNLIGLFHFGTEAFVFKTAKPSGPWFAPVIVASIGLVWSLAQYNFYVR